MQSRYVFESRWKDETRFTIDDFVSGIAPAFLTFQTAFESFVTCFFVLMLEALLVVVVSVFNSLTVLLVNHQLILLTQELPLTRLALCIFLQGGRCLDLCNCIACLQFEFFYRFGIGLLCWACWWYRYYSAYSCSSSKLSKAIWNVKKPGAIPLTKSSIVKRVSSFQRDSKTCRLCIG